MSLESRNPNKLKHLKGQEGPIHDIDKALVMAEVENGYRETAKMYETYCSEGSAFEDYPVMPFQVAEFKQLEEAEENGEPVDETRVEALLQDQEVKAYSLDPELYEHDHPVTPDMYKDFVEWQKKGVSPDYVRQVGEQIAEQGGAIYDYANSMEYKSDAELKKDIAKNVLPLLFHLVMMGIHEDQATDSTLAQNPNYQNQIGKSKVTMATIISALNELRERKHPTEFEEEELGTA